MISEIYPLKKTVFFENGDAQLRYCCTGFCKVSTLRCVFEGAINEVRYIAAFEPLRRGGRPDGRTFGRRIKGFLGAGQRRLASWMAKRSWGAEES